MKVPRVCRVCDRELPPPTLSAIRRAEMFGWYFRRDVTNASILRHVGSRERNSSGADEAGGRSEASKQQRRGER